MSGPNGEPHVAVGGAGGNEDEDGDSFGDEGAWGRPGAVPPAWPGPPGLAVRVARPRCAQMFCCFCLGAVPDAQGVPAAWLRGRRVLKPSGAGMIPAQ